MAPTAPAAQFVQQESSPATPSTLLEVYGQSKLDAKQGAGLNPADKTTRQRAAREAAQARAAARFSRRVAAALQRAADRRPEADRRPAAVCLIAG